MLKLAIWVLPLLLLRLPLSYGNDASWPVTPTKISSAGVHKKLIAFFEAKKENNWYWRRIRYS